MLHHIITISQTRPLLQGHQDPSIPAVRQTERAQEQEAGHQPGRNRVNGKLETSQWFQPPPPELQFVDDELPVEVECEGRHNLQGAWLGAWARQINPTFPPAGNHSFSPPWRTTIKDADAKSKPRVTGGWCLGQCRSSCVLPDENAWKSCSYFNIRASLRSVWKIFWSHFEVYHFELAACLNHQASSSVPLNYVFVDKAKAKHPMIATIPAGTRCGFPRFMASAWWTIRAECTVNVGWMGKCCL